ncbi:Hint domain-containing protein [Roseicyclus mahoneyensis]|uniref:Hint domain-containing protein n=2 Tax=Roseicyclus mahoneyensis TaxID=164332 RepID=A0A316GGU6_9RHOB|nr:Hint domain-containing protein [Roseicyclus mahoneyensis]
MGTGFRGAFVISWTQTWVEGFPAEPQQEMVEGMAWSWHGYALPLEGDGAALILTASRDHAELRSRAARVVRKLLQRPAPGPAEFAADEADPVFRGAFVVSDGTRFFTIVPVVIEDGSVPILMFVGDMPPPNRDLTIVQCSERMLRPTPSERPSVICFTPGTRLRTETGDIPIEDLGPGDRLLTRDSGPQAVLWAGNRRMSGARLFAMPDQRPIRLRRGALGLDRPEDDLVVSPEHRVLVTGQAARDLWGEPEVLVRAADLVGDRWITVDHSLRETWYIHLMLERHEVIWANGLEVESFHPGFMGLDTLSCGQRDLLCDLRPELATNPDLYGPPARRMVNRAEAAILLGGVPTKSVAARH